MDALKRIVRNYNGDMDRLRFMDMTYYTLRKDGAYAGVSLWDGYEPGKPHKIAVHDGTRRWKRRSACSRGCRRSGRRCRNRPVQEYTSTPARVEQLRATFDPMLQGVTAAAGGVEVNRVVGSRLKVAWRSKNLSQRNKLRCFR